MQVTLSLSDIFMTMVEQAPEDVSPDELLEKTIEIAVRLTEAYEKATMIEVQ